MIIALDFDGVLHPRSTHNEPVFCRLPLLEQWMRANQHVDVIISSSWREAHPLDEMKSYFSGDLQHRILGTTPISDRLLGRRWVRTPSELAASKFARQYEIEAWMKGTANPGRKWVALDDEPRLFEPGCQNLVLCNHETGLSSASL